MTGVASRLPTRRRALAWGIGVLTLVLFVVITILGAPLHVEGAPLGIVSLQFAASPEVAASVLAAWADVSRSRILWAHGLDHALPFAYASAVGMSAAALVRRAPRSAPSAAVAAGSALVAAVADQVENVAMWVSIVVGPSWSSVLATLSAAIVKSAGLGLALGALAVAALSVGRSRAASGGSQA